MRILYLTDQTYLHGGIEKVLSQKANFFAEVSNDEVIIVTYNQNNNSPIYPFSDKIMMIDLEIYYEIGKSYFHPINLKKIPEHRSTLQKLLRKIQPEVVISCSFGPDFYFLPSLEKNIPKIKEFHSSRHFYHQDAASAKDWILKKITTSTEKKYDQLVVLNSAEQGFYQNCNISIIPNPAQIGFEYADLSSKKIIAAGRISPVKNFKDLIEAFSLLAKDFQDWELHFWGDNYLGTREVLEEITKKKGLSAQIKFKGTTSNLKKEMENYSIYAMTSETECFPMVLLEALSVGLPIISYDCPTGPSRIITDKEDGYLVPYKDPLIFAEQLKRLMNDENLRKEMGLLGKKNAARFEISTVMQQWKELFQSFK